MQVVIKNFVFIQNATVEISEGFNVVKGENLTSSGNSSNGSGKTLLLEAIAWCLWGMSLRGAAQASLVGPYGREMSVSVSYNGLTVCRTRQDSKATVTITKNGEIINFQKTSQAQERINEELGINWDNAKILVYFGEYSRHVLDMSASERRDAIVGLMEYPDETHKQLADNLNEIIRKTDVLLVKNDAELNQVKTQWETTISLHDKQIENLNNAIEDLKRQIESCSEGDVDIPDEGAVEKERSSLELQLSSLSEESGRAYDKLTALKKELEAAQKSLHEAKQEKALIKSKYEEYKSNYNTQLWNIFHCEFSLTNTPELDEILTEYRSVCKTNAQYDKVYSDWLQARQEVSGKLESVSRNLAEERGLLSKLESKCSDLSKSIEKKSSDRAQMASNIGCGVCPTCKQSINSESAKASLQSKIEDIERSILSEQSSLDEAKESIAASESRLKDIESSHSLLSAELEAVDKEKPQQGRRPTDPFTKAYKDAVEGLLNKITFSEYATSDKTWWTEEEEQNRFNVVEELTASVRLQSALLDDLERQARTTKSAIDEADLKIRSIKRMKEELQSRNVKKIELSARLSSDSQLLATAKEEQEQRIKEGALAIEEATELHRKRAAKIEKKSSVATEIRKLLASYKYYTVTRFIQTLEEKINDFLSSLSSDIRCKVEDDGGDLEFLFTDSSKSGQYYPYKLASRGERTRIKKVFFQVFIEMFSPPFILSDESYDGLDEMGAKSLSEFTFNNNQDRCFIEATPLDMNFGSGEPNIILCQKRDDMIRIIQ